MVAPPVPPHIAGDEKVDRDWLIAHLGRGPFFTWQRLLWCRDTRGITWATRAGTAKHISVWVKSTEQTHAYSGHAVEKHLVRLREALLSKHLGYDFELVGDKMVRRRLQIIYGGIVKPREVFTIPDFAKAALAAKGPIKWGGARVETGPEKGAKYRKNKNVQVSGMNVQVYAMTSTPHSSPKLEHFSSPKLEHLVNFESSSFRDECSSLGDECSSFRDENVQVCVPITDSKKRSLESKHHVLFASLKERGGPGGPPSLLNKSEKDEGGGEGGTTQTPNPAAPSPNLHLAAPKKETPPSEQKPHAISFLQPVPGIPPTSAPKSPGGANSASGGLQAWWDNWKANRPKTWRRPAPVFGECGIPAFPRGLDYHFPPPPMPTLRHKEDIDAGVMFLERWYNAALTSRYAKVFPVRAPKAGNLRQYWELAVLTCVDEGISAGAWVAFSIDESGDSSPACAEVTA